MNSKRIHGRAMRSAESQTAKHPDMTDSRRETFYGELNALLGAGVDFSNAFALLIEAEERGAVKAMLLLFAFCAAGAVALSLFQSAHHTAKEEPKEREEKEGPK